MCLKHPWGHLKLGHLKVIGTSLGFLLMLNWLEHPYGYLNYGIMAGVTVYRLYFKRCLEHPWWSSQLGSHWGDGPVAVFINIGVLGPSLGSLELRSHWEDGLVFGLIDIWLLGPSLGSCYVMSYCMSMKLFERGT